jgi:hypothetical protein
LRRLENLGFRAAFAIFDLLAMQFLVRLDFLFESRCCLNHARISLFGLAPAGSPA